MGDRGNIVVQDDFDGRIYLYTHWGGTEIQETAANALAKWRGRWDDAVYLRRLILNELQGDDRGETGFGISAKLTDNEHPIVVLDCSRQMAWNEKENGEKLTQEVPFEEFVECSADADRREKEGEK